LPNQKEKKRRKKIREKNKLTPWLEPGVIEPGCDDAEEGEDEGCPSFCCSVCEKGKERKEQVKRLRNSEEKKKRKEEEEKNQNHKNGTKSDKG